MRIQFKSNVDICLTKGCNEYKFNTSTFLEKRKNQLKGSNFEGSGKRRFAGKSWKKLLEPSVRLCGGVCRSSTARFPTSWACLVSCAELKKLQDVVVRLCLYRFAPFRLLTVGVTWILAAFCITKPTLRIRRCMEGRQWSLYESSLRVPSSHSLSKQKSNKNLGDRVQTMDDDIAGEALSEQDLLHKTTSLKPKRLLQTSRTSSSAGSGVASLHSVAVRQAASSAVRKDIYESHIVRPPAATPSARAVDGRAAVRHVGGGGGHTTIDEAAAMYSLYVDDAAGVTAAEYSQFVAPTATQTQRTLSRTASVQPRGTEVRSHFPVFPSSLTLSSLLFATAVSATVASASYLGGRGRYSAVPTAGCR